MKIAIRLDDITENMDWEKFLSFKELLDNYGIKPLIGIIPDNRDISISFEDKKHLAPADFWQYVRELIKKDGWTAAMHGCTHIYTTKKRGIFPLNAFSELAGVPYEKQLKILSSGKAVLSEKGITTDIFMAPAHSYDNNTLRALKELGFNRVTDGFGSMPYVYKGTEFYPISARRSSTLKKRSGYSTFVVHTNTMSGAELKGYEELFRKAATGAAENIYEFISYDELLKVEKTKRGFAGRAWEYMLAAMKRILVKMA